jgi:hypothetical protein
MKTKPFYLFCLLIVSLAACNKDGGSGGSNYYMKANIGGTEKTYTTMPLAMRFNQNDTYVLSMSAGANEGLGLQITQTGTPLTTTQYLQSGSGNYVIAGVYNPGTADVTAIFGAGLKYPTSVPLQIVISNLTSSEVSGTFSGMYYNNSGVGTDSILITNGSFSLPIQ